MKRIVSSLLVLSCATLGAFAGCNQNPVAKNSSLGAISVVKPITVDGSTKLDILWVIDNSGSMCQEQKILGDNFDLFVDELQQTSLDFQIGVTTTHMFDDFAPEPVAIPGNLQATPQPVPGNDRTCKNAVDGSGQPIAGDWTPIRAAIATAVSCMATPDESLNTVSDADIACAVDGTPMGCEIVGKCTGNCTAFDLFPSQADYAALPKVLKSVDYRDANNALDVPRLKQDFGCMSLVGTRGYGIEKGLGAAREALKPELIGGAIDGDESLILDAAAPNHGLIRADARFALLFVTDENDCTHDGSLDEASTCLDSVCEYANIEGVDGPLITVNDIKSDIIESLSAAKGREFGEGEMLVASVHGTPQRFTGPARTEEQCSMGDRGVEETCATQNGIAFSGDRYERFLQTFPESQYFPKESAGFICEDFGPILASIGEFISSIGGGCITRDIFPCEGPGADCPSFPVSGAPGTCVPRPNSDSGEHYCDSGIQVRTELNNPSESARLTGGDFCQADTFGLSDYPNGCIIDQSKYTFGECPAGLPGVTLIWNDETAAKNALVNTSLQIRYNSQQSDAP